jgi:HAD superfamily hydrolase (TIGR01662 family)
VADGPHPVRAVFFDVDFTLIYPGPTFQGEGYRQFCAAHGVQVDPARFIDGVVEASSILHDDQELAYSEEIFIRYTRRIIEVMGGRGEGVEAAARDIYVEWAACHHFVLYDDVAPVLRELAARELKIGLISNSHRSMAAFQDHFELHGLIAGAISSSEHGYLKPHPSIFEAALRLVGVDAHESVMVGDSMRHDIEGARRAGMRGVLVQRADSGLSRHPESEDVPVIRSLSELPALLGRGSGPIFSERQQK